MMTTVRKLLDFLTKREQKRAALLMCMILVMALLDMIGVASIMPFIAVLANPEIIEKNAILNNVYTKLNFTNPQQFLFIIGIIVFILLVTSLAFKALTTYAQLRFTLMREYSISKRLVEGYLCQPYSWFLTRHSADLGKTILSEVKEVIDKCVSPMMTLIAQSAVALALLMLLIVIDPHLALIACLSLTATYAIIFKISSSFLARIGEERLKANQERFTVISEAFGAVKEVKVGGLEQAFIQRFTKPANGFVKHQASEQTIRQIPRFALEAVAFGGMLLLMLYLMAQNNTFANVLPIITLYAFAGYRLMPAMQQIYGAVTQLRFAGPALDALHTDLMSLQALSHNSSQKLVLLQHAIKLKQVLYSYPNAPHPALNNLSITISAGSKVALVGTTGSGKTTTVDIILGLLEAQHGSLEVDGQVITEDNRYAWQRNIGYVPQQIYLADDTIAANIAFGLEIKDIDQNAVERAAKIANLHTFVTNELPQQYQTTVGERGVRLSGGQRQRIGIARALYHNPQVLIFDEATSALDNLTEQAVMDAVHNLGHEVTVILIAHRLSTVISCDSIFMLEKGKLIAEGTFKELAQVNEKFRAMAGA